MSADGLYPLLRGLAFAPRAETLGRLEPGERVGRFELLREIDRGGFGFVYEARDPLLGRHVAIKVLRVAGLPESGGEDPLLARLRREAEAVARLSHPNIVTLHDFGTHAGLPFLVFELLLGETLRSRLRLGPLPLADALEIAAQVARGLAHAHEAAVIHRDLNPNNIFLLPDGRVKILDFGLARLRETLVAKRPAPAGGATETAGAGTPAYMAPEQWRGDPVSARTDVYSAGVVLYEMIAGRRPFEIAPDGRCAPFESGEAPPLPDVPEKVAAVVARALRLAPEERFQSAARMLEALLDAQKSLQEPLTEGEPYRYLDAFTEADERWFFGRSKESARLRSMLANHALVCVLGPSGAGKSSLVQAGLIPRVRREGWTVLSVRPGAEPLRTLCEQARRHCEGTPGLERVEEVATKPALLGAVLRAHARRTGRPVLLFVDQLEELYRREIDAEARALFAAALLGAADDREGPVRAALTLREDHISRLSETPALRDEISQGLLLLGPPEAEGLFDALRGPARRLGYELEEGLAEEIVAALMRDPGEDARAAPLPLLQLTASRLWEKRDTERRLLSRAELGRLRGVSGIIATHAEDVYQTLPGPDEREIARHIFLALVSPERTARHEERGEILGRFPDPEAAARVLEHLIRGRLVVASPSPGDGRERVGLAHESLIVGWDRLQGWIEDLGEERRLRERLSRAAAQWIAENRSRDALWSGQRLREELARARSYSPPLSPQEREFLEAARRLRVQRRRRLGVALLAAATGLAGLLYGVLRFHSVTENRLAEAASRARASGLLAAAAGEKDPLLGVLVLSELANEPEPPGGMKTARRIAQRSIPRHLLRGHEGPVLSIAYQPDGSRLATGSHDGTVRVWRADGTGSPLVLEGGGGVVAGPTFSPDGLLLAAGFEDRAVRVWRLAQAGGPTLLRGHDEAVTQIAFSPEGARLVTASRDGTARVWRLGSKDPPIVLRGHGGPIRAVAFNPRGVLVTASDDGSARLWRLQGSEPPRILRGHGAAVRVAVFSPDGSRVLTGSGDGTARIWRIDSTEAPIVLRGHREAVTSAAFDPEGRRVLIASEDGTAHVWSADGKGKPVILRGHAGVVRSARFSPDGLAVLTASEDATARLWPSDGSTDPMVLQGHSSGVASAVFSPDGVWVATASLDATVRVWPTTGPPQPLVIGTHISRARSLGARAVPRLVNAEWGRKHDRLVSQHADGHARVWRLEETQPTVLRGSGDLIHTVLFSPDDTQVLVVGSRGLALLWRADGTGEPIRLVGHEGDVIWGAFSPDGKLAVTASRDRTARIWRTDGQGSPIVLRGHEGSVSSAVFTLDGARVITGSADGTARIWRSDGRGEPLVLRGHSDIVNTVDISPDGSRIVTASFDGTARVWPLRGGEPIVLRGHGGRLRRAVFSPDGSRIATVSVDHTARVWRADGSGEPVVLTGHEGTVLWGSFSPDGSRLVTGATDHTTRLWRLEGVGDAEVFRGQWGRFNRDGSLLLIPSYADGVARVWIARWKALVRHLRASTTACLTAEERSRLLAEPPEQARARFEACERRYGRWPRPAARPPRPMAAKAGGPALELDTDRTGLSYREFDMETPSPELCRQACVAEERCRAFSFHKPGVFGKKARCYLKADETQRRWSPDSISGVVR